MTSIILKKNSGTKLYSYLKAEITKLQKDLIDIGYPISADGVFGQQTEKVVKAFQNTTGLKEDGIVGPETGQAIRRSLNDRYKLEHKLLPGFKGNLSWIHEREGHRGEPYWPGGGSGITLDPGVDLGHAPRSVIESYRGVFPPEEFRFLESVLGLSGEDARAALERNASLKCLRVNRKQARTIFIYTTHPYWIKICHRFPVLSQKDVSGAVQTAMLSLAYNRGAENNKLDILAGPLSRKSWLEVSERIGGMQQKHKLSGIRSRRRMEAELIKQSLA